MNLISILFLLSNLFYHPKCTFLSKNIEKICDFANFESFRENIIKQENVTFGLKLNTLNEIE